MKRIGLAALGCIAFFGLGVYATAHMMSGHSGHHMYHGGNGHHQHDDVNMLMLNDKNTTQDEVAHMRTLFQQHPSITRNVKNIENGIVENGVIVTQTSANGDVVAALQKPVGEVSDLAERGMVAVHEQMMKAHH